MYNDTSYIGEAATYYPTATTSQDDYTYKTMYDEERDDWQILDILDKLLEWGYPCNAIRILGIFAKVVRRFMIRAPPWGYMQ